MPTKPPLSLAPAAATSRCHSRTRAALSRTSTRSPAHTGMPALPALGPQPSGTAFRFCKMLGVRFWSTGVPGTWGPDGGAAAALGRLGGAASGGGHSGAGAGVAAQQSRESQPMAAPQRRRWGSPEVLQSSSLRGLAAVRASADSGTQHRQSPSPLQQEIQAFVQAVSGAQPGWHWQPAAPLLL